jgi:hypothetical protein
MTKGIEIITVAEISLWESWKHVAEIHNGYDVRNKYHRECSMDMWWEKKNSIDKLYRMLLISHNNKRIASEKEENNRIHIARVNEQIRIESIVNIMNTQVRRSARISCRKNNLK